MSNILGQASRERVAEFLALMKSDPASASNPKKIAELEAFVEGDPSDGFATETSPIAPYTWEVRTLLAGAANDSGRVKLECPFPCEIVGVMPTIEVAGGVGLTPTQNSIDVKIDLNKSEVPTDSDGFTVPGQPADGDEFVTLSLLSIQSPRLLCWRLVAPANPIVGVTWRWKLGAGTYKDAVVTMGFYARRIRGRD